MPGRAYKIVDRVEVPRTSPFEQTRTECREYLFTVLDGSWVVETAYRRYPNDGIFWSYYVVGPEPQAIELDPRHFSGGLGHFQPILLVGTEPFGIVECRKEGWEMLQGRYFKAAQLIHKNGQLGPKPEIEKPEFAVEGNYGRRDRRRNAAAWARLIDVARLIGMSPVETVLAHFDFTDRAEPRFQVTLAKDRDEIHGKVVRSESIVTVERQKILTFLGFSVDVAGGLQNVWVRKGWAMTVLYLQHFGWKSPALGAGAI